MRRVPGLLPYALAAVAVVVSSAIALSTTIRAPGLGAVPAPTTAAAVRATLSDAGRLAYWRKGTGGDIELWASDLDGGRRWVVASAGPDSDVALTHWSPDGSAIGYTVGGVTLGIARLDGTSASLDIPPDLRAGHWKIVSFELSPDGSRVAASLRAGSGLSDQSDVYLADARAGAAWRRITTLGDAFAGKWISATQLFIETASGLIAVADVSTGGLRPLTGMPGTSPAIGRDGRVYFVGGRFARGDVSAQPFASGWVWAATVDGDDLRRVTTAPLDQMRFFGMLADGRAAVGVPGGVYLAGDDAVAVTFQAGTVRKLTVSDDGRRLVGITESRVLLVDPAKVVRPSGGGPPPQDAATVLLGSVRDADAWFARKNVALARGAAPRGHAPRARLAFALGRNLWIAEADGSTAPVLSEPVAFLSPARWSPAGDRLAAVFTSGTPARVTAVVAGVDGTTRFEPPQQPATPDWSPDGGSLVFMTVPRPLVGEWSTQLYDATTGQRGETIPGRAIFAAGGRLVLTDGEVGAGVNQRVGQRLELSDGRTTRVITDSRRLAGDPLLQGLTTSPGEPVIFGLAGIAGPYVGVSLQYLRTVGSGVAIADGGQFVVIRLDDGRPVWTTPLAGRSDLSFSPSNGLVGWTVTDRCDPPLRQAFVADPADGRIVLQADGRFAGWSPEPGWIYVARDAGLFAVRLSGGDAVRVGPFGVPVVAAPAR